MVHAIVLVCSGAAPQAAVCRVGRSTLSAFADGESQEVCCRWEAASGDKPENLGRCEVMAADGSLLHRGMCQVKGGTSSSAHGSAGTAAHGGDGGGGGGVLASMSWMDRLLPVLVISAMVLGVLLGKFVPQVAEELQVVGLAGVSLPIALGLWFMMLPVLTQVRYEVLYELLSTHAAVKQFILSFILNWILGPLFMTGLAWSSLPDLPHYRNGVIMVGLARCIAMVLLWNQLAGGHAELCAMLVAFNSCMQIVLYAPLSLLYLQVVSGAGGVHVSFWLVARSVLVFLGVPLVAGILLRSAILHTGGRAFFERKFMPCFGPVALLSLLYTIVVLFASQGKGVVDEIGNVARVSVPMLIYFCVMFFGCGATACFLGMDYNYTVTQAFTAASNNFELAIAVSAATFGATSPEALAATVGPLIEVPVLLLFVYVARWCKPKLWNEEGQAGHT